MRTAPVGQKHVTQWLLTPLQTGNQQTTHSDQQTTQPTHDRPEAPQKWRPPSTPFHGSIIEPVSPAPPGVSSAPITVLLHPSSGIIHLERRDERTSGSIGKKRKKRASSAFSAWDLKHTQERSLGVGFGFSWVRRERKKMILFMASIVCSNVLIMLW